MGSGVWYLWRCPCRRHRNNNVDPPASGNEGRRPTDIHLFPPHSFDRKNVDNPPPMNHYRNLYWISFIFMSRRPTSALLWTTPRYDTITAPRRAAQNEDDGQIVTIVASISRDIVHCLGVTSSRHGKLDGTRNQMSWIILPLIGVKARDVWWIFKWLMWMLKGEINYRVFAGYTSQLSLISIPELRKGWQAPSTCQLLLVRWAAC